jgi:hypothetical protein
MGMTAAIPQICFNDPPQANDLAAGRGVHVATAINLGARRRL